MAKTMAGAIRQIERRGPDSITDKRVIRIAELTNPNNRHPLHHTVWLVLVREDYRNSDRVGYSVSYLDGRDWTGAQVWIPDNDQAAAERAWRRELERAEDARHQQAKERAEWEARMEVPSE